MSFEDVVKQRQLNKWDVLFASLIAGFSKLGILNQAVVNKSMEFVADKLARFFKIKNNLPEINSMQPCQENLKRIIHFLNNELMLAGEINIIEKGDEVEFQVVSNTCNFCPKAVGEAELPGTACPYPALIREFANKFLPEDQQIKIVLQDRNSLKKEGNICKILFKRKE